jgi:hypothetical protein
MRERNKYASRIQRCYRKYKLEKDKFTKAIQKRVENATKAKEEIIEIKVSRRWGLLPKLSRSINETFRKLKKVTTVEQVIQFF